MGALSCVSGTKFPDQRQTSVRGELLEPERRNTANQIYEDVKILPVKKIAGAEDYNIRLLLDSSRSRYFFYLPAAEPLQR